MFDDLDYKTYDFEASIDPERNVLNTINVTCDYFTEEQFRDKVDIVNTFSLIHINCRSLYRSFASIEDFLYSLRRKFQIIALSETWLDENKGCNFCIEGFDLYFVNRITCSSA